MHKMGTFASFVIPCLYTMTIDSEHLQQLRIYFQTLMAPPPYSYQYEFVLNPQHNQLQVSYQLTYTERNTLTEEEILEEGFMPNEDFSWEGPLPAIWLQALQEIMAKTQKLKPNLSNDQPNLIRLQLTDMENQLQEGVPNNLEGWEYFLQEMTQAVFELSQKEQTLIIRYREIGRHKQTIDTSFQPVFSQRKLQVEIQQNSKTQQKTIGWQKLKPLLKAVYLPDYDNAKASSAMPDRPGRYIDPGEGIWYDIRKDLTNPGKQYDAIGAMEREIERLIEIEGMQGD